VVAEEALAVQVRSTECPVPPLIVMDKAAVAVCAVGVAESVTLAVNGEEPAVVGVPEIVPFAALRFKPAGSVPELMDHVYGVVPPVAVRVAE